MATNDYGLDARYFEEQLSHIIRHIDRYRPDEMYRALHRLSEVAAIQADIEVATKVKFKNE